jgi:hypothetical protein
MTFNSQSTNSFLPRAVKPSPPGVDASPRATDGQRTLSRWGTAGRPFSAHRRGGDARSSRVIEGIFSWVNQKGILPSRPSKCGAMNCNRVQWIAPRRSRSESHAPSGKKRQPRIGHITRACSLAWLSTGSQATEFQTQGAWRLSVCSHSPRTRQQCRSNIRKERRQVAEQGVCGLTHNPRRSLTTDRVGVATHDKTSWQDLLRELSGAGF